MSEITQDRSVKKQPRKRKLNFSKEEQLQIIEFVKNRTKDVMGNTEHCGAKVDVRKQKAWEELAVSLRNSGWKTGRTWRDIRKKWWVLKRRAMRIYCESIRLTGERPTPNDLLIEKVLEVMAPEGMEVQPILGSETEAGCSVGSWLTKSANSQWSEDDINTNTSINGEGEGTGMENLDEGVVRGVKNLNTAIQPNDLIHSQLLRISAQLNTIIELLRMRADKGGKEQ